MDIIEIGGEELSPEQTRGIWDLLVKADEEFVPPLSRRESTTQQDLLDRPAEGKTLPTSYFTALKAQRFLLLTDGEAVKGFMSYIPAHTVTLPDGHPVTCEYVSTVIVDPATRGRRLTERMYRTLFERSGTGTILTRTWSTNHAHLNILDRLGFETAAVIQDDRGPGIDTVYRGKRLREGTP